MDQQKRHQRQLKRVIKRAGQKRLRRQLKRDLTERPDEAPHSELAYGKRTSQGLNGIDQDATRRREEEE